MKAGAPCANMLPPRTPYFADAIDLPCILPTIQKIENSQDILVDQSARRVVGVDECFVVKYGEAIDLIEAENLVFLFQHSIPVPKVYAFYEERGKKYIVMERVPGENLQTLWPNLELFQKEAIMRKLRKAWEQIRAIPSPGGYCSLGRRPLEDGIFWSGGNGDAISGPFDTEEQLNEGILKKYRQYDISDQKAAFYHRAFPHVLKNHPSIFTQADVQRKNVIVRRITGQEKLDGGEKEGVDYEITIVDWETSGWYPSYWEYSKVIFACGGWNDDWHLWVGSILDERFVEWAWVDMVMRDCWS